MNLVHVLFTFINPYSYIDIILHRHMLCIRWVFARAFACTTVKNVQCAHFIHTHMKTHTKTHILFCLVYFFFQCKLSVQKIPQTNVCTQPSCKICIVAQSFVQNLLCETHVCASPANCPCNKKRLHSTFVQNLHCCTKFVLDFFEFSLFRATAAQPCQF